MWLHQCPGLWSVCMAGLLWPPLHKSTLVLQFTVYMWFSDHARRCQNRSCICGMYSASYHDAHAAAAARRQAACSVCRRGPEAAAQRLLRPPECCCTLSLPPTAHRRPWSPLLPHASLYRPGDDHRGKHIELMWRLIVSKHRKQTAAHNIPLVSLD